MKRVAIYACGSGGNNCSESIQEQIDTCVEYAEMNGALIDPEYIFVDGSAETKDGLHRLMQASEENGFDTVLVDKLSRVSSNNYKLFSFVMELRGKGVFLCAVLEINSDFERYFELERAVNKLKRRKNENSSNLCTVQ